MKRLAVVDKMESLAHPILSEPPEYPEPPLLISSTKCPKGLDDVRGLEKIQSVLLGQKAPPHYRP